MRTRYKVTLEDVAALGTHQLADVFNRRWDKPIGCMGLVVACFFLVLGVISTFDFEEDLHFISLLLCLTLAGMHVFAAVAMFTYPRWLTRITARELARMNKDGKISGVMGTQELELTEQGLVFRSEFVESCLRYEAVRRIESEVGHTYISTTLNTTFVIPHAKVTEGDPEAFADALRPKLPDNSARAG